MVLENHWRKRKIVILFQFWEYQMEVRDDEDNGIVYHSLPKQKRRPKRLVHSLSKAVEENRANAKKNISIII